MHEFPPDRFEWPTGPSGEGTDYPRILSQHCDSDGARLLLDISPDLIAFRGHFLGNPVLAGIVQLHWAVIASRSVFGFGEPPREIKNLKFKSVVTPPTRLELAIARLGQCEVQYDCSGEGKKYSQGRLVFSGEETC